MHSLSSSPNSSDKHTKQSHKQSQDYAFLLIPNIPIGIEFGIDCMQYEIGKEFKGISVIPPGLHFLYHNLGLSGRQGYFVYVKKGDLLVRSWDHENIEIMNRDDPSLTEMSYQLLRQEVERGDLNANLGPYPIAQYGTWKNLISFVSMDVLRRTKCDVNVMISSSDESMPIMANKGFSSSSSSSSVHSGVIVLPCFVDIFAAENKLNIGVDMDSATMSASDRAALISRRNIDKSTLLLSLIRDEYNDSWCELLGELQLAFLMFMLVYSYHSLNHWKALVHLICQSEQFLSENLLFSSAFIRVLYEQLHFVPTDFFSTELSRDNFLGPCFAGLFSALDSLEIRSAKQGSINTQSSITQKTVAIAGKAAASEQESLGLLLEHKRRLLAFVQKKFGIFEDDAEVRIDMIPRDKYSLNDEDGPVIVDQSELPEGYIAMDGEESQYSSSDNHIIQFSNEPSATADTSIEGDSMCIDDGHKSGLGELQIPAAHRLEQHGTFDVDNATVRAKWDSIESQMNQTISSSLATQSSPTSFGFEHAAIFSSSTTINAASTRIEPPVATNDLEILSEADVTTARYGWRYPLLFGEMQAASGAEDLLMTAMRVMDGDYLTAVANDKTKELLMEASLFIESECSGIM